MATDPVLADFLIELAQRDWRKLGSLERYAKVKDQAQNHVNELQQAVVMKEFLKLHRDSMNLRIKLQKSTQSHPQFFISIIDAICSIKWIDQRSKRRQNQPMKKVFKAARACIVIYTVLNKSIGKIVRRKDYVRKAQFFLRQHKNSRYDAHCGDDQYNVSNPQNKRRVLHRIRWNVLQEIWTASGYDRNHHETSVKFNTKIRDLEYDAEEEDSDKEDNEKDRDGEEDKDDEEEGGGGGGDKDGDSVELIVLDQDQEFKTIIAKCQTVYDVFKAIRKFYIAISKMENSSLDLDSGGWFLGLGKNDSSSSSWFVDIGRRELYP